MFLISKHDQLDGHENQQFATHTKQSVDLAFIFEKSKLSKNSRKTEHFSFHISLSAAVSGTDTNLVGAIWILHE